MMLFLGIITVLFMVFGFAANITILSAIFEIQALTKHNAERGKIFNVDTMGGIDEKDKQLLKEIVASECEYTNLKYLNFKTIINLIKYLYTNNPYSVVPKHQKYFRIFANLFLISVSIWLLMPFYFLYLFLRAT
ncbi:exported hypothetical protein [Sulfurovum sp. enrichment culture clone C5]|uniref:Uncharacterized protein n=1 Tax=Sulfurovum sp. enrichment culture clone C5 TaxID=497650 RepID=A0A0S4XLG8_9BACT|nr:exported hypothetical protein [Sulfurovum sp. enrichment culture clone C5]